MRILLADDHAICAHFTEMVDHRFGFAHARGKWQGDMHGIDLVLPSSAPSTDLRRARPHTSRPSAS